jgi:hypothetical protein
MFNTEWFKYWVPCLHRDVTMWQATLWTVDPNRRSLDEREIPIRLRKLVCDRCGKTFDQKIEIPENLWKKGVEL